MAIHRACAEGGDGGNRYLSVFWPPANPADLVRGPVHQGLSKIGFVEGKNMMTEYRWAEGHYDRLPALATDLVSRKVDLIVTIGGTPPTLAGLCAKKPWLHENAKSCTKNPLTWDPSYLAIAFYRGCKGHAGADP